MESQFQEVLATLLVAADHVYDFSPVTEQAGCDAGLDFTYGENTGSGGGCQAGEVV